MVRQQAEMSMASSRGGSSYASSRQVATPRLINDNAAKAVIEDDLFVLPSSQTPRPQLSRSMRPSTVAAPIGSRLGTPRRTHLDMTQAWMNAQSASLPASSVHSGLGRGRSSEAKFRRPGTAAVLPSQYLAGDASVASGPKAGSADAVEAVQPSQPDPALLPAAGIRPQKRPVHVRLYPHAPMQQSIVDQVVFGRDMDYSGEDQFDEEFLQMFNGCAGRGSWDTVNEEEVPTSKDTQALPAATAQPPQRRRGKHKMTAAPGAHSIIDKVVFGNDTCADELHEEFWIAYQGLAGRPSWKETERGLRQLEEPPGRRAVNTAREIGKPDPRKRSRGFRPRDAAAAALARLRQQAPGRAQILPLLPGE